MSFVASKGSLGSQRVAIFDFDGTLADSLQLVIREYNLLAPRFRTKPIALTDLSRLRQMKAQDLLREHEVSFWKLPFLVSAMRRQMRAHVTELQPFSGVVDALRALESAGVACHILSTNSAENIRRFLARHALGSFGEVMGGASMGGKATLIRKFVRRTGLDAKDVLYVGDEVRDLVAARRAGVRGVAVSWGYADAALLRAERPYALVETPHELLRVLSADT